MNIQANRAGNVLPVSTAPAMVVKLLRVLTVSVAGVLVSNGGAALGRMAGSWVGRAAGRVGCTVGLGADEMVERGITGADEMVVEKEPFSL